MKIADLIKSYELEIATAKAAMTRILADASAEKRERLTVIESKRSDELTATIERVNAKLAEARAIELDDAEYARQSQERIPARPESAGHEYRMTIGSEAGTYGLHNDPRATGEMFLGDLAKATILGDQRAQERLARYQHEVEVNRASNGKKYQLRTDGYSDSTDFVGMVVPQYLVAATQELPGNGRPFLDYAVNNQVLSESGMALEIPRVVTGVNSGLMATELTPAPVTAGNFTVAKDEALVQYAESWQITSIPAIDRGQLTETVLLNEMILEVGSRIELTCLTQATNGMHTIAHRVEYDDGAPTALAMLQKINKAAANVNAAVKNRGRADTVLMAPRRWDNFFIGDFVDVWPLIGDQAQGSNNMAAGNSTGQGYNAGAVGRLPNGLSVYTSHNVPVLGLDGDDPADGGDEDIVYVYSRAQFKVFEPANREILIRAQAPTANMLGIMYVVYEPFAYYGQGIDGAMAKVDGTGTSLALMP